MSPGDPRHGSHAGYQAHRTDGEPACQPCLRANARYHKGLMLDYHRGTPRKVAALGTRRRIQALMRLGWSMRKIAAHAESSTTVICFVLDPNNDTVLRSTAEQFARTYDALSMQLPTGQGVTRARQSAERKGYAPPLAWDCIDDPNEQPAGIGRQLADADHIDEVIVLRVLGGEDLPTTRAEKEEIMRRWIARGGSETSLCNRMRWKTGRYVVDAREREAS